ncbi:MAG: hypothetical protein JWL84_2586 [Rhodospirillales bacterium]|nr:hypothetical protein [Rhodospirillales bacterium]
MAALQGANTSVGLLFVGGSSGSISGNSLSANSSAGQFAVSLDLVSSTETVTGNTFTVSGGTLTRNLFLNSATISAGSTGNTLANGGCFNNGGTMGTIGLAGGATCP